jgi:hypothetical protein
MVSVRSKPYVWVTSICQLLAGQAFCEFRPWFIANHQDYEKQPSDFNGPAWRAKHAELVRKTAVWQREDGSTVFVEAQNRFVLPGKSGTVVAGQPDLIRLGGKGPLVTDCKTGQAMDAHIGQVMCYMLLLPYTREEYRGLEFSGRVQYEGFAVDVPFTAVGEEFRERFRRLIAMAGGERPPAPTPSEWECRYCPITSQDCAARIDIHGDDKGAGVAVDLF